MLIMKHSVKSFLKTLEVILKVLHLKEKNEKHDNCK